MQNIRTLDPRFLRQVADIGLRFIAPETLSSLIPVSLYFLLAGIVDQVFLISYPSPVRAFWWLVVQSIVVGRFALAARDGHFHADLFEKFAYRKLPGFALRYIVVSLIWAVPVGGLLFLNMPIADIRLTGLLEWLISNVYLAGSQPFSPDLGFWLLLLALSSFAFLPLLCAVLATQAKSPAHFLFPSLWKHTFQSTTPLLILPMAFLGAMLVAFFLYLPLLGAAAVIAFHVSRTLGTLLAGLTLALPIMSWPIIGGRLAGTWVYFHPLQSEPDLSIPQDEEIVFPASLLRPTTSIAVESPTVELFTIPGPQPATQLPPVPEVNSLQAEQGFENLDGPLAEITVEAETQILEAAKKLVALKKKYPEEPRILGLEVQLLIRLGHKSKAMSLAMPAVLALMKSPYNREIAPLFVLLGKERHTLPWDATMLDMFVKVFLEVKDFKEAGWCGHTCELQLGNVARAGKRLVQIADAATAARDYESSVALLKYYIKHHPDGPFVEYAQKSVEFNLKQQGT